MATKKLKEQTSLDDVNDAEQRASEALSRPESQAYWDRRAAALKKVKELESLADRVDRNSQASLADLKEAAIYRDEAAHLRRRADESADDLSDFAPSVADMGSVPAAGTTTETPEQRRERLRRRQDGLKEQGVRDYAKRVADEEGITTARLRQIISPQKKKDSSTQAMQSPFTSIRKTLSR